MSLPMFSPVNSLGKTLGRRERPPRRCLRARPADGQVDHESGRFHWLARSWPVFTVVAELSTSLAVSGRSRCGWAGRFR